MRISSALLCDFATVREGLLTVVSAGISRLAPPSVPAPLSLFVALVIEVDAAQRPFPHEVRIDIDGPDGESVGKVRAAFQAGRGDFDPDEPMLLPIPVDLRPVMVARPGWHQVAVAVDDAPPVVLRFKVAPQASPGAESVQAPPLLSN